MAAVNTVAYRPVLSGGRGLAASGILAAWACSQILRRALRDRRERALSALLLMVFCVAQVVQFARSRAAGTAAGTGRRGVDFSAYYVAGRELARGHAGALYELPRLADGRLNLNAETAANSAWSRAAHVDGSPFAAPYIYPPFFAVLAEPLTLLPFWTAYAVWIAMSVAAAAGAMLLTLRMVGVRPSLRLMLLLGTGLFCYYPFFDNLFYGQIGAAIVLLFAAGAWMLARGREGGSALCFALATAIKLTPVLLAPVLVLHRRWRWLAAYAGWSAALLALSVWRAGWAAHATFLHAVLPSMSCGAPVCQNASLIAWVEELFLGRVAPATSPPEGLPAHACSAARAVALGLYAAVLAMVAMRLRARRGESGLERGPERGSASGTECDLQHGLVRDLAAVALLTVVLSPISWWHHAVLDLFPFVYFWALPGGRRRGLLAITSVAVATNLAGLLALTATRPAVQLALAAVTPLLTLLLVLDQVARPGGRPQDRIAQDKIVELEAGLPA